MAPRTALPDRCLAAGAAGVLALTAASVGSAPAAGAAAAEPPQTLRSLPELRLGDRGPLVRRLNKALHVAPATRTFHRGTARAVRSFRAEHGLKPRAVVGARVWRLLLPNPAPQPAPPPPTDPQPRPDLAYGDTSSWVLALQQALGVQPATGWFGPKTEAAVRAVQSAAGLPATGRVDAATWALLGTLVAEPAPDPTMTAAARTSAAARASVGLSDFVTSPAARLVVQRESGGQCAAVSPGGTWRGRWQMDAQFWAYYGGTSFAATADAATCEQQDLVAYRGWVDRWWDPWRTDTFPD